MMIGQRNAKLLLLTAVRTESRGRRGVGRCFVEKVGIKLGVVRKSLALLDGGSFVF